MLLIDCQGPLPDQETLASGKEANNDICKWKWKRANDNYATGDVDCVVGGATHNVGSSFLPASV